MNKLSIVILTFNSEKYLFEVLRSCEFASEVILIDSGSTDMTLSIAQSFNNVRCIKQKWLGFGQQKQFGINQTSHDWVFVLDSDEIITEELQKEITIQLLNPNANGYYIPRINFFFGKPIKYLGLYPDYTIRFFNKHHGKFTLNQVHEKIELVSKPSFLTYPMKHYAYESVEQFIAKQNSYSTLGAKRNVLKAILNPYWTFFKLYF